MFQVHKKIKRNEETIMKIFTFVVLLSAFLLVAGNAVPAFANEATTSETDQTQDSSRIGLSGSTSVNIHPKSNEEDDPEPTDPTEPSEPTNPEEPSEPTDPSDPDNPTPPSFELSGSASVNIHPKQSGEDDPEPSKQADTKPIENPANTGVVIAAVEDSKSIIQSADGTTKKVEGKEIGTTVQKAGTVTVKDNDGKIKVLPKTGDEHKTALPLAGLLMSASALVLYLFTRKRTSNG